MEPQLAQFKAQQNNGVFPVFSVKAVQDHAATEAEGRPMFRDEEWVKIYIAGDKSTIIERKVSDLDKQRFSQQYELFKGGAKLQIVGTPLDQWPLMTTARVAELRALNIHTVEALADVSDASIHRLGMGARDLVTKAKAFLEVAKSAAGSQKQAIAVKKLEDENSMLKDQVKALSDQIDELKAAIVSGAQEKPKRGRPKKAAE